MEYHLIKIGYWTEPSILDMPTDEKDLYMYLMTNKHINSCGIISVGWQIIGNIYENPEPLET